MRGDGLSEGEPARPEPEGRGAPLARAARRVDEVQRRHAVAGFPLAVFRKYSEDRGGNLAAMLAYFEFFSLFPLLAVATTILGRVLADDPELQRRLLDTALRNVPLIGSRIATDLRALDAGGVGLAIAIVLSIWAGLGAIKAFEVAMNTVWNVPEHARPGFLRANLRAFAMLVGLAALTVVSAVTTFTILGGLGWAGEAPDVGLAIAVHGVLFLVAFAVLTSAPVGWTAHLPGAIVAAVAWTILLRIGRHDRRSADRERERRLRHVRARGRAVGLALPGVEPGARRPPRSTSSVHDRLWPRTMVPPPLGQADRRALKRFAAQGERRPEVQVEVRERPPPEPELEPLTDPGDAPAPVPARAPARASGEARPHPGGATP